MKWKDTGSNTLDIAICSLLSSIALAKNHLPFLFLSPIVSVLF